MKYVRMCTIVDSARTRTLAYPEHQGPMRFEAKNCSKWHFSPVSCMSGESALKGWIEPELKTVEDVKDQGAEKLLNRLMKQKEIGKKNKYKPRH